MINPGPVRDLEDVVDDKRRVTLSWLRWFRAILIRVMAAPQIVAKVRYASQTAAVAEAALYKAPFNGMYRISWYIRISYPATVSSSVQPIFTWTSGGFTWIGTTENPITDNTATTSRSGVVILRADEGTEILHTCSYSFVGADAMIYDFEAVVEAL